MLEKIRTELRSKADEKTRLSGERFFKEEVKLYGINTAEVGRMVKSYFKEAELSGKSAVLEYCEDLFKSGYMEEAFIACEWAEKLHKQYVPEDMAIFERWLNNYVSNWAVCDTLCNHTIGSFVDKYPQFLANLKVWARSKNRWLRRASAVTLIIPAKNGKFLEDIFQIADILLQDKDDMVQKGYGWMLKAAANKHQQEVFEYVVKNKKVMPRTALRYAIEKMPLELKRIAMEKG